MHQSRPLRPQRNPPPPITHHFRKSPKIPRAQHHRHRFHQSQQTHIAHNHHIQQTIIHPRIRRNPYPRTITRRIRHRRKKRRTAPRHVINLRRQTQQRLAKKNSKHPSHVTRHSRPRLKSRIRQMRCLCIQPHPAGADIMRHAPILESHAHQIHSPRPPPQKQIRSPQRIARNPQRPRNVVPAPRRKKSRHHIRSQHALNQMMESPIAAKRHHIPKPLRGCPSRQSANILRTLRTHKFRRTPALRKQTPHRRLRAQSPPAPRRRIHNHQCLGFHAEDNRTSATAQQPKTPCDVSPPTPLTMTVP